MRCHKFGETPARGAIPEIDATPDAYGVLGNSVLSRFDCRVENALNL
ncbi:hypothetical protein MTBBW1_1610008 [Desulfamplus magnetovallimortis]|uniref:Uncharacterized protein n=1 Tax=Desulfamplus magnetovallimortis TaxID=1246637 RepID=A0A1W1H8T2_9BACT|nr:hypothetical protein MTBBW1_1610008 [Desulfamplus magnetovallimortis]